MRVKKFYKYYYLMLIPGLVWVFIYKIIPMFGILMAFERFNPGKGIFGSPWVGLANFKYMFQLNDSRTIFFNTIFIAFLKIMGNLIVPVVVALLLNELRLSGLKKGIQTIIYLPHFLSWVILAGILLDVFAYHGPINSIRTATGSQPILFFAKAELFVPLVVGSDVWKEFGFNAVVYLAALTAINPELYEAAAIDGAGRFQRILYITLPGIRAIIILMSVLSLRNVLEANFDQIFNLYNPLVYSTGDIIDTWVYRMGLLQMQYGLATAVGLLKSVVGFVMISLSYFLARKYAGYNIF
jgi:putative aldouronate transport system permease protein